MSFNCLMRSAALSWLGRPPVLCLGVMIVSCLPPVARAQTNDILLLGPVWGARPWLDRYGVSIGLNETSEVLGNATGGLHTGPVYDGMTQLSLGVDLGRAVGLKGGTINVSALQIHGRDLSDDNLEAIDTVSSIEARRATRLWEVWYDQQFDQGRIDAKIGLQSVDQEFLVANSSSVFVNAMFGWPALPSYDMYSGGPAYPLASLGIRGRYVHGAFTLMGGVFGDNPGGGPFEQDPQPADGGGKLFNFDTGALFLAELDYAATIPATGGSGSAGELPGTYKIGGWFDSGNFPDLRYDDRHQPYAGPDSDGNYLMRRHNYALYGVADQAIWKPDPKGARSVNLFLKLMGAPGDRNQIDFAANAGIVLHDPLPGRDGDTVGIGGGYTKLARSATQADRDAQQFAPDAYSPPRSGESYLEVTYQYCPFGWLTLQPDLQYIFVPGGGVANPGRPGSRISNEFIAGLRGTLAF